MIKNKVMFLIVAYVGINATVVTGAEKERIICKKIMNMYTYSKDTLDQKDLALFIQSNEIASVTELIAVLERGKTLLNYDIVNMKTENKSASSYWATLLAAPFVSYAGCGGLMYEYDKDSESRRSLKCYINQAKKDEIDAEFMKPYVDNGKFDHDKYFSDVAVNYGDQRLVGFMGEETFVRGQLDKRWNRSACIHDAQLKVGRLSMYLVDGKFNIDKYQRFNPKPVEYVMHNLYIYTTLIAAGLIAIPIALYKLYKHYTYTCNKQKEIAILDAIIEQITLMQ